MSALIHVILWWHLVKSTFGTNPWLVTFDKLVRTGSLIGEEIKWYYLEGVGK